MEKSPIYFAHALDKAAKEVGVNFIGGYSALVHKGFSAGDYALISSIPQALAETDLFVPLLISVLQKQVLTWMLLPKWVKWYVRQQN